MRPRGPAVARSGNPHHWPPGSGSVGHVFEEIVSRELGRLYSAALFMCGGAVSRAEDAIVDAVGHAASEYPGPFLEDATGWLEDRVVLHCLDAEERLGTPRPSRLGAAAPQVVHDAPFPAVAADVLYGAAAELPPRARAALWCVMFSRRGYADVAALLDASRAELLDLLAYRDAFVATLRRRARGSQDVALPGG